MEHYYTNDPTVASQMRQIEYSTGDKTYRLWTDRGVFSVEKVDKGSDLLIRNVMRAEAGFGGTALDMGCGYGPIGLVLASAFPNSRFCLIDVNERAMDLSRKNAKELHVEDRICVGTWEALTGEQATGVNNGGNDAEFDLVVTNPPIRAGKQTVYALFQQAFDALRTEGRLYVVIRKNQGADSATKELKRLFGNCETLDRESGYHILLSRKE